MRLSVNKKKRTRVPEKEGGCGWAAVAATAAAVAAAPAEAAATTAATAAGAGAAAATAAGTAAAAAATAAVAAGTAAAAAADCSGLPAVPCSSFVVGQKWLRVAKNGVRRVEA